MAMAFPGDDDDALIREQMAMLQEIERRRRQEEEDRKWAAQFLLAGEDDANAAEQRRKQEEEDRKWALQFARGDEGDNDDAPPSPKPAPPPPQREADLAAGGAPAAVESSPEDDPLRVREPCWSDDDDDDDDHGNDQQHPHSHSHPHDDGEELDNDWMPRTREPPRDSVVDPRLGSREGISSGVEGQESEADWMEKQLAILADIEAKKAAERAAAASSPTRRPSQPRLEFSPEETEMAASKQKARRNKGTGRGSGRRGVARRRPPPPSQESFGEPEEERPSAVTSSAPQSSRGGGGGKGTRRLGAPAPVRRGSFDNADSFDAAPPPLSTPELQRATTLASEFPPSPNLTRQSTEPANPRRARRRQKHGLRREEPELDPLYRDDDETDGMDGERSNSTRVVEAFPGGDKVLIMGQAHTKAAIAAKKDNAVKVKCGGCGGLFMVGQDAELLFCPTCETLTPTGDSAGANRRPQTNDDEDAELAAALAASAAMTR